MMSTVRSEPFLSLEPKGGTLTVEEELDHHRQRFQSMKLVLKELQQQVLLYKTRCAGVDTVALLLKESKQEVMKLTTQRNALDTAVANLQNRLTANGLSSSVNIEETELFVPGASKQTLDNLARENARLRSLLKSHEGQNGKNSPEEIQSLKASLENLEAENNLFRGQILEMDSIKQALASQFEEALAKIKEEYQVEKLKLEKELNACVQGIPSTSLYNEFTSDVKGISKATQTVDVDPSQIDELRRALKLLSDQCLALDVSLEHVHITGQDGKENEALVYDQESTISEQAYMELKLKLSQVVQMNQRWQAYNHSQEQQVHGFLARITELEQLNQEGERLRNVVDAKEIENHSLRKEIDHLTREANKLQSYPQFDISMVEILKQQIQVCTEDFNTERKDREHAINRAKQLQDEVNKLMHENDILKRDIENMRTIKNTPEYDQRESQLWTRPQHPQYFTARGGPVLSQRIPFSLSSSGAPVSFMSTSSAADRSSFYPPSSQDSMIGFQGPVLVGENRQQSRHRDYKSLSQARRNSQESSPVISTLQNPAGSNVSLPALSKKTEDPAKVNNRQTDLTCPRCSKEFTEDQNSELIRHINTCTD